MLSHSVSCSVSFSFHPAIWRPGLRMVIPCHPRKVLWCEPMICGEWISCIRLSCPRAATADMILGQAAFSDSNGMFVQHCMFFCVPIPHTDTSIARHSTWAAILARSSPFCFWCPNQFALWSVPEGLALLLRVLEWATEPLIAFAIEVACLRLPAWIVLIMHALSKDRSVFWGEPC